jgi:GMP synthase PP-ATPase subunit
LSELNLLDSGNSRKDATLSKTSIDDIFSSVLKSPGSRITISINALKAGHNVTLMALCMPTELAEPLPDATKDVLNDLTGGG